MKYLLFLSISAIIFVGCGSSSNDQETSTSEPEVQEQETPKTPTASPEPYTDIGVDQFKKMMSQPDVVLLDVRTPEETAEGKIEGAIEINIKALILRKRLWNWINQKPIWFIVLLVPEVQLPVEQWLQWALKSFTTLKVVMVLG